MGRSRAVTSCGLTSYEDPGTSNSISRRESWTPHSTRVSGQCSSAQSKAVLRQSLIANCQKGNRLRFRSCAGRRGNARRVPDALGWGWQWRRCLKLIMPSSLVMRRRGIKVPNTSRTLEPMKRERIRFYMPVPRTITGAAGRTSQGVTGKFS